MTYASLGPAAIAALALIAGGVASAQPPYNPTRTPVQGLAFVQASSQGEKPRFVMTDGKKTRPCDDEQFGQVCSPLHVA